MPTPYGRNSAPKAAAPETAVTNPPVAAPPAAEGAPVETAAPEATIPIEAAAPVGTPVYPVTSQMLDALRAGRILQCERDAEKLQAEIVRAEGSSKAEAAGGSAGGSPVEIVARTTSFGPMKNS